MLNDFCFFVTTCRNLPRCVYVATLTLHDSKRVCRRILARSDARFGRAWRLRHHRLNDRYCRGGETKLQGPGESDRLSQSAISLTVQPSSAGTLFIEPTDDSRARMNDSSLRLSVSNHLVPQYKRGDCVLFVTYCLKRLYELILLPALCRVPIMTQTRYHAF